LTLLHRILARIARAVLVENITRWEMWQFTASAMTGLRESFLRSTRLADWGNAILPIIDQ